MVELSKYRKFVVAFIAAGVTVAQAFGVPGVEELSTKLVAAFDAVAAALIWAVPNEE